MSKATLEILQLADSCFPSGGFAFSNGLECLGKLGYVKRMTDFHQYLECYLEQLTTSELPFLNSAYVATLCTGLGAGVTDWKPKELNRKVFFTPEYVRVAEDWNAWLFLPAQRKGSLAQGQAWLRVMEETYGTADLRNLRQGFIEQQLSAHFLMVLAASLKLIDMSLEAAQSLLIHMALRDQLGAAVRLGLLGSLQAQKLHRQFIEVGEGYRMLHADWTYERAHRTAPMIELAQASHAHLYSKLFQS